LIEILMYLFFSGFDSKSLGTVNYIRSRMCRAALYDYRQASRLSRVLVEVVSKEYA